MGVRLAPFAAISHRFPTAGRALTCGILAAACRLPGFAFGIVAGGVSRGHSGRCARGGSVVRFLQRTVLFEVGENSADGGGFFDAGHDPHRAAAVAARAHVDVEDALEALCPGHRTPALNGAAVVDVGPGRCHVGGWPFAAPRWRQLRAQLRVWRTNSPGANLNSRRLARRAKGRMPVVKTPWKRVRCARGGGTSAASLAMKSTGSKSTCVVPFFHGVLSG